MMPCPLSHRLSSQLFQPVSTGGEKGIPAQAAVRQFLDTQLFSPLHTRGGRTTAQRPQAHAVALADAGLTIGQRVLPLRKKYAHSVRGSAWQSAGITAFFPLCPHRARAFLPLRRPFPPKAAAPPCRDRCSLSAASAGLPCRQFPAAARMAYFLLISW